MKKIFVISSVAFLTIILILFIVNENFKSKYNELFDQYSIAISNARELENCLIGKDTLQFLSESNILEGVSKTTYGKQ